MILPGALPNPAGNVGLLGVVRKFPVPLRLGGCEEMEGEDSLEASELG